MTRRRDSKGKLLTVKVPSSLLATLDSYVDETNLRADAS